MSGVMLVAVMSSACLPRQGERESAAAPVGVISSRLADATQIDEMPAHVVAPLGEITLFADYADRRGEYVVLYLVNRTARGVAFDAQSDDPYCKLEMRPIRSAADARWRRAQPHRPATCGNSYFHSPALRPDEFFRFLGYAPADGEPAEVRYRLYVDEVFVFTPGEPAPQPGPRRSRLEGAPVRIVSNAGRGYARPEDVRRAARDPLAASRGDFETLVEVIALPPERLASEFPRADRFVAVARLERFPTAATARLLAGLLDDPDERVRQQAVRTLVVIAPACGEADVIAERLLRAEEIEWRAPAVAALGERACTPELLDRLEALLHDAAPYVRLAALNALADFSDEDEGARDTVLGYGPDADAEVGAYVRTLQRSLKLRSRP